MCGFIEHANKFMNYNFCGTHNAHVQITRRSTLRTATLHLACTLVDPDSTSGKVLAKLSSCSGRIQALQKNGSLSVPAEQSRQWHPAPGVPGGFFTQTREDVGMPAGLAEMYGVEGDQYTAQQFGAYIAPCGTRYRSELLSKGNRYSNVFLVVTTAGSEVLVFARRFLSVENLGSFVEAELLEIVPQENIALAEVFAHIRETVTNQEAADLVVGDFARQFRTCQPRNDRDEARVVVIPVTSIRTAVHTMEVTQGGTGPQHVMRIHCTLPYDEQPFYQAQQPDIYPRHVRAERGNRR